MDWPFDEDPPGNLSDGMEDVPTSAAAVGSIGSTTAVLMMGMSVRNPETSVITLTLMDGNDVPHVGPIDIQPGSEPPDREWGFRPMTGLRWVASAAGLKAQIWGYTR